MTVVIHWHFIKTSFLLLTINDVAFEYSSVRFTLVTCEVNSYTLLTLLPCFQRGWKEKIAKVVAKDSRISWQKRQILLKVNCASLRVRITHSIRKNTYRVFHLKILHISSSSTRGQKSTISVLQFFIFYNFKWNTL